MNVLYGTISNRNSTGGGPQLDDTIVSTRNDERFVAAAADTVHGIAMSREHA